MKCNQQNHKKHHVDINANKRFFKIQLSSFAKRELCKNANKRQIQNKNQDKKRHRKLN